jgi:hypothetical protein
MRSTQLRVLSPCHENYDAMRGGGATRFCERCEKSVTNLSELTRAEAQRFLAEHAGQSVCVRYRRRGDGEILFRPTAPVRLAFVAALSFAMAACTGYLESEDLDSPEDALVCHDASGYAIPCAEVDDATIPVDEPAPVPEPLPDEIVVESEHSMGVVMPELPDGTPAGEGCPIPAPPVEDIEMGDMPVPETEELMGDVQLSRKEMRKANREARRRARADERTERRLARQR